MASVLFRIRPIGILILCSASVFSSVPAAVAQSEAERKRVVRAPRPEYPLEARRQHLTGSGLLILHINRETGTVDSIDLKKSTGHKILDDAAIRCFLRWRFIPGKYTIVKVPVQYTLKQSEIP